MNNFYSAFLGNTRYWLVGLLMLWTLPWKGWALWRAAQRKEKAWFVALLVLNTVGLLEILYVFVFSKEGDKAKTATASKKS